MAITLLNPSSRNQLIPSSLPMKQPRNPSPNRSNGARSNRKKQRRDTLSSSRSSSIPKVSAHNTPVVGHVRIFTSREQFPRTAMNKLLSQAIKTEKKKSRDAGGMLTRKLVWDPKHAPVELQVRVAEPDKINGAYRFYAGSAFITSPSPRSLPLPAFPVKNSNDSNATRDLRRILGLSMC